MKRRLGLWYTLPLSAWMVIFFLLPTLIIFVYSFLKKGPFGGVQPEFSLRAFEFLFNPTVLKIAWKTLWISVLATFFTIVVALPSAYYIARSRYKNIFLFLIIIPFWTNFLIRIYAWIAILGNNGFLNSLLQKAGLIADPFQFLYNTNAVILIIVYTYLPYAVLPLYSSMEKFDFGLLEAAQDLGASHWQSIRKIFVPGIKAGVMTAIIFTIIPALGSYAIPQLVGGNDAMMLGNVVAREVTITRNWPLASAISLLLSIFSLLGIWLYMRKNKQSLPVN